jgi:hypothetical protein
MKKLSFSVIKSGSNDNGFWAYGEVEFDNFPIRTVINTKELSTVGEVLEVPELIINLALKRD